MSDTEVQESQPAPDFTLPAIGDDNVVKNGQVHLGELAGHTVVLYFYPKDDTPGCVLEACSFRDANHIMQKQGIVVLGVSADDIASHQKFADKYGLSFTLLADEDTTVSQRYGVWKEKNMYGKKVMGTIRSTFIIDPKGKIVRVFPNVKVDGHVDAVLAALKELSKDA